ncbi:MAG: sporulation protein [Bacteroidota bacterium]
MVFKRVKQWLGIEGVKLEIVLPEEVYKSSGEVTGQLKFKTMNTQQIRYIKIALIEKYTRGRRKNKRIDEYLLGEIELEESFMVYPEEEKFIDFELSFSLVMSNMDAKQHRGGLGGGVAQFLKWTAGAKSEYRIEAEAKVAGTALSPFDKKPVTFK